ncbi:MAG: hypothetical protein UT28_C0001G0234 [Berkelbacteria bacterium GW2011_GWE1_39_12]|uniref:Uncharacterized protein n=1 Tax=Berkelbacteria bacterium GW2011_GWE1_39_12 TaxID=1618337 RepID=A0A0G4B390_9BACT|nr:MAG: hypothetical protein UT28_C0001G0234 [Berkelbacteria bacterium GW2011_GWE1_39_12]
MDPNILGSKPVVSKWLWIILAIIVVLAAGFFSWYYLSGPGKKVTATTPTTTAADDSSSTTVMTQQTNQIITADIENNDLVFYYFDTTNNKLISKTTGNNKTGLNIFTGSSMSSMDDVQFDTNGNAYFLAGEDPAKTEPESPYVVSRIYQSPDKLIFQTDEKTEGTFSVWRLNKAGVKVYVATPKDSKGTNDYNLISVDTKTLQKENIASLGAINSRLFLNSDETKIMVIESRERIDSGYHYRDFYAKTVDLTSKKVGEKLIYQGTKNEEWFSADFLTAGPKLLKAAGSSKEGDVYTLKTVDLANQEISTPYTIKGIGQVVFPIQWSPDGMKLLFGVAEYGDKNTLPKDQGIVEYDYNTGKSQQIITTEMKNGQDSNNRAFIVNNSFDGSSFIYFMGQKLYYYDIAGKKQYEIGQGMTQSSLISSFRFVK